VGATVHCRQAPAVSPKISHYIGRETIVPTERIPGMLVWREGLYAFMQRNAERQDAYFCIPVTQVVEMGIEI
jgi:KUP system potassium uptake protein